jgi:hypothetical protein
LGKWLDLSGGRLHLSRHPARPAPRAGGRHSGPVVSFLAGHGNLRLRASARLLPLAGHLNHRGQWQGHRKGEVPVTPPRSLNCFEPFSDDSCCH